MPPFLQRNLYFLYILIAIGILLTSLGGYLDITQQERWGYITKQHAWNDGLVVLVLCVLYYLIFFR
jgi:hypothetical protein